MAKVIKLLLYLNYTMCSLYFFLVFARREKHSEDIFYNITELISEKSQLLCASYFQDRYKSGWDIAPTFMN
jgi:hypothetical protein